MSFAVHEGESLGIVGESGSGKSTIAFALFDSVLPPGEIVGGSIRYFGTQDLLEMSEDERRNLFWARVSMVFQAAQNTLNPLLRVSQQIRDLADAHDVEAATILAAARELCATMHLDPDRVLASYPHELSGGMKQRVSIMLALLLNPSLVVLDEPTTALDVISQASVLRILDGVRKSRHISLILITHDISVVSEIVDRVLVMYAGRVMETGAVHTLMERPRHPYTRGLLGAIPPLRGALSATRPLLGQPADLLRLPPGCPFQARCPHRWDRCVEEAPPAYDLGDGETVACHLYDPAEEARVRDGH